MLRCATFALCVAAAPAFAQESVKITNTVYREIGTRNILYVTMDTPRSGRPINCVFTDKDGTIVHSQISYSNAVATTSMFSRLPEVELAVACYYDE